jgi:hypothetical protein
MLANQRMQARHAIQTFNDAALGEELAIRVDHTHVMMALGPVDTNEDHRTSLGHRSSQRNPAAR